MTPLRSRDDILAGFRAAAELDGFSRNDLAEYLNVDPRELSLGRKPSSYGMSYYRFSWDKVVRWAARLGYEIRFEIVRVKEAPQPPERVPYRKSRVGSRPREDALLASRLR